MFADQMIGADYDRMRIGDGIKLISIEVLNALYECAFIT